MVVQKFGGTSVADPVAIRRLIEIVRAARTRDGRGPAVVVSAMSGVTDGLLGVAASAGASRLDEALSGTQQIRDRHIAAARELVAGPAVETLHAQIDAQIDELTDIIKACQYCARSRLERWTSWPRSASCSPRASSRRP